MQVNKTFARGRGFVLMVASLVPLKWLFFKTEMTVIFVILRLCVAIFWSYKKMFYGQQCVVHSIVVILVVKWCWYRHLKSNKIDGFELKSLERKKPFNGRFQEGVKGSEDWERFVHLHQFFLNRHNRVSPFTVVCFLMWPTFFICVLQK